MASGAREHAEADELSQLIRSLARDATASAPGPQVVTGVAPLPTRWSQSTAVPNGKVVVRYGGTAANSGGSRRGGASLSPAVVAARAPRPQSSRSGGGDDDGPMSKADLLAAAPFHRSGGPGGSLMSPKSFRSTASEQGSELLSTSPSMRLQMPHGHPMAHHPPRQQPNHQRGDEAPSSPSLPSPSSPSTTLVVLEGTGDGITRACNTVLMKRILKVDFTRSRFDHIGIRSLCKMLVDPRCALQQLCLDEIQMHEVYVSDLCAAVKQNTTLTAISMQKCGLDDVCGTMLKKMVKYTPRLMQLHLNGNYDVYQDTMEKIQGRVENNRNGVSNLTWWLKVKA